MEFNLLFILKILCAAMAAVGFAVISNPPKRAVALSALLSAIAFVVRYYMHNVNGIDIASATFGSSLVIGSMSLFFARMIHCPNEVFTFPSMLPMIPGKYAYNIFLSIAEIIRNPDNTNIPAEIYNEIFINAITASSILVSLVIGVALPVMIFHKESFSVTRKPKILEHLRLRKHKTTTH